MFCIGSVQLQYTNFVFQKQVEKGRGSSYLAHTLLVLHICHNAFQSIVWILGMIRSSIIKIDNLRPTCRNRFWRQLYIDRETNAAASLPSCATNPSRTNFIEVSGSWFGDFVGTESNYKGCYIVGLESLHHLFGHDRSGHSGSGVGSDCVDVDVVFCTFTGKGTGEAKDTTFLFTSE